MKENIKKSPFSILFVDDEENARKYFDKGLRNDFTILTAANVDEAQKIIMEHYRTIAVVITDQRMPGGNGVKLLKFLRENYPHIIRLLTTAYSDLTEAIEAVNSGEIFRYIQKPWDYNLLKVELYQAMELFELRLERNQMLHEKIMVKRKMTKIERVKIILLFAKIFRFLNFSDISVQKFIRNFATNTRDLEDDQNWQEFDFANQDILETKFLADFIDKIQTSVTSFTNYDFDKVITGDELKSLIEKEAQNMNLSVEVRSSTQTQSKVSSCAINIMIKKLLEISSLSQAKILFSIDTVEEGTSVSLDIEEFRLPENNNFFIATPNKLADEFYINILICYLLIGHHGGEINISCNNNLKCILKLPSDPSKSGFYKSSQESIENIILATML